MQTTGILLETKRFAIHDGPGIRTTFFLKGCFLKCIWCHNPESISGSPQLAFYRHKCINCRECAAVCPQHAHSFSGDVHFFDAALCNSCGSCETVCMGKALKLYGKRMSVEEALQIALEDRDFYLDSNGGVTVSGGEPLFQPEFTLAFLAALKENGIHTALDTCCFAPCGNLQKTLPLTDLYLVDFKHADSAMHRKLTGQPNELIKENLQMLSRQGAMIEIRIPFVPGCNDSDSNMENTGKFLSSLDGITCVKLLPYHDFARAKYVSTGLQDTMPVVESPGENQIQQAVAILKKYGLNARSGRE